MNEKEIEFEYLKLWQTHSRMLWSRLQTAALLHSGILVSWYTLHKDGRIRLAAGVLVFGVILSSFILAIMVRDTHYVDVLKNRAGAAFPTTNKSLSGRLCAYLIVGTLMMAEIILFFYPCIKKCLNL